MSEIALVSARKARLETMAKKGDLKAKAALELSENPEKFLSTAQIFITLIAILTGVYSGEKFGHYMKPYVEKVEMLQPYAETISTVIIVIMVTFLSKNDGKKSNHNNNDGSGNGICIFPEVTYFFDGRLQISGKPFAGIYTR